MTFNAEAFNQQALNIELLRTNTAQLQLVAAQAEGLRLARNASNRADEEKERLNNTVIYGEKRIEELEFSLRSSEELVLDWRASREAYRDLALTLIDEIESCISHETHKFGKNKLARSKRLRSIEDAFREQLGITKKYTDDEKWSDSEITERQSLALINARWGGEYQGAHSQGIRQGYGTFLTRDGDLYEGHWINNKLNGKCKVLYADKSTFEGVYSEGKRNGYGRHDFSKRTDNFYTLYREGVYENNRLKNGKVVLCDGKTYEGEFEWIEYLGFYSITNGTHRFENSFSEGSFAWSKEKNCFEHVNGKAILYKNDKLIFEGQYKNRKQNSGYFAWNNFFSFNGEVARRYKNIEYGDDCLDVIGSLKLNENFNIIGTFNLNMDEHNPTYVQKDEIKITPKSISKYEIKYINGDIFKSEIQDLIITFTEKEQFKITTGLGVLTQGNKNITGHIESNVFKKQSFFDKLLG